MTKGTPHQVFIADSTRSRVDSDTGLAFVDEFAVRGRTSKIRVWTVAADPASDA
jgi:class 3 adenylate cyclase